MNDHLFKTLQPRIHDNAALREPQLKAYETIERNIHDGGDHREIGIVLPVGCGKSGLITLAPFAVGASRVLVIAPGLRIAGQLLDDFNPANDAMFYRKCAVLTGGPYPEPAEIRGKATNKTDLDEADVVVTNIQQLQGAENKWLAQLDDNYFDLILFDEGHHSVAESWNTLRDKFPAARIINLSATPTRADGRLMAGEILYTYPVYRAIQKGFVKHIKGLVLNPKTLRYVRREDGQEVTVTLDEVRELGEIDAGFRRSIVSSKETLDTIVDASISELKRLRKASGEPKLKIIASALNMEHCKQVVAAYRERGIKADYMHSREDQAANKKVLAQLDRHELDVIVQVRMLGEGFDHPYLAVAAVFSIFRNLSPFVQFVGRIMRVVKQDAPGDLVNQGTVVFHAGANTTAVWDDFKDFAEADQEFFRLLTEQVPVGDDDALTVNPEETQGRSPASDRTVRITEPGEVSLVELNLLSDKRIKEALEVLKAAGVTADQYGRAIDELERTPVTKQSKRQANKALLDETIKTRAARILGDRSLSHEGHDLDHQRLGRSNWVVLKAAIDKQVNKLVGRKSGERHEFSQADLDKVNDQLDSLISAAEREVFDGGT